MRKRPYSWGIGSPYAGPLRRVQFTFARGFGPYGASFCISVVDAEEWEVVVWSKTWRLPVSGPRQPYGWHDYVQHRTLKWRSFIRRMVFDSPLRLP